MAVRSPPELPVTVAVFIVPGCPSWPSCGGACPVAVPWVSPAQHAGTAPLWAAPRAWPGAVLLRMMCSGQRGPASCTQMWQLLLPGWCLGEQEEPGGGWENVSGMLHPSYMHRNRGSPMCLSLRALLMPPQSPPRAEVSARLAGGQGGHGEEDGAARREESGKAGSCLVCTAAPGAGQDGLLAGLTAGQCGGPTPHWGG